MKSSQATTITFIVAFEFSYCDLPSLYSTCKQILGSIHIWDLLCVKYRVNLSLSNRLYCTKWVHSHFLFGQLLCRLKNSIIGCVPSFCNFLHLKVHAIVHTLKIASVGGSLQSLVNSYSSWRTCLFGLCLRFMCWELLQLIWKSCFPEWWELLIPSTTAGRVFYITTVQIRRKIYWVSVIDSGNPVAHFREC